MVVRDSILFWLLGVILALAFLVAIKSVLLPFVVAIIAAYFLDPAADRLEDAGFSRTWATVTITALFFLIVAGVLVFLGPALLDQLRSFISKLPEYVAYINKNVIPSVAHLADSVDPKALASAREAVSNVSGYIVTFLGKLLQNIWQSGVAVVNLLSLIFITPVVTFYILRDWDRLVAKINGLMPPAYAFIIREQFKEIDRTLSGYIRGQTHVCLILGAFYAIGLSIAGLEFGLFIGMATGILTFIPYVGMLFGFSTAMIVAFFQYSGDASSMAIIAAIFIVGQAIEGNFITPKLVGDKVGLHPVWIIFGMLAGGALFGFTGILLAVPVTAVIGVLVRFAIVRYMHSDLYQQRGEYE